MPSGFGLWECEALEEGDNEAFLEKLSAKNLEPTDILKAYGSGQNWILFDPLRKNALDEPALVSRDCCEWEPLTDADDLNAGTATVGIWRDLDRMGVGDAPRRWRGSFEREAQHLNGTLDRGGVRMLNQSSLRQLPWAVVMAMLALTGCGSCKDSEANECEPVEQLDAVSLRPPMGATNVYVGTTIEVVFNGCVTRSSSHSSIDVFRGTHEVAGQVDLASDSRTLIFTPSEVLAYGTNYHVVVNDTIRGVFGERLEIPVLSTFMTQGSPDENPPTTTVDPPGGIFNTPVTVTLTCEDDPGGTGCAGTWYTLDGTTPNQESLAYDGPFVLNDSATVSAFSVDHEGNIGEPVSAELVIDTVPPSVVSASPAAGSSGVARTTSIVAIVDEALDPDFLNEDSLAVTGIALRDWTYDEENFTLTLVPHQRLRCGQTYEARVSGTVQDLAGNSMGEDYHWSFVATESCTPPRTLADVPGGLHDAPFEVTLTCADAMGAACARIVYTTDGSAPTGSPPAGTTVDGDTAGPISITEGHTVLRFFGEDATGNREPLREERYTVTNSGITWVSTGWQLHWGVGPVPDRFVPVVSDGTTWAFEHDPHTGRLYRGAGRFMVSDDGGETWSSIDELSSPHAVHARGSQIYAASGQGLLISDDGGTNFRDADVGDRIVDITGDDEEVFFAAFNGLWRTADDGQTFVRLGEASGIDLAVRVALLEDLLLVGTYDGLYISTDRGSSFVRRDEAHGLPHAEVRDLFVFGSRIFVGSAGGLAWSDDGAESFTALELVGTEGTYDEVDHVVANEGFIYAYAFGSYHSGLFRSTDEGASFVQIPFHPESEFVLDRLFLHDGRLWVGATPGYHVSDDGGATFEVRGPVGDARLLAAEPGSVYATTSQDGLAQSRDGGISWRIITQADGLGRDAAEDVFVDGQRVYAITFTSLSISEDGGQSFTAISSWHQGGPTSGMSCVVADGQRVWVAGSPALDVSEDGGRTFTQRYSNLAGCYRLHVDGARILVATRDGVAISEDGGESFSTTSLPIEGWIQYADDLAVDGAGKIWAVGDRRLFVSLDGGASFEPAELEGGIETVRAYGELILVGMMEGLAISIDGGQTFVMRNQDHGLSSTVTHVAYVEQP